MKTFPHARSITLLEVALLKAINSDPDINPTALIDRLNTNPITRVSSAALYDRLRKLRQQKLISYTPLTDTSKVTPAPGRSAYYLRLTTLGEQVLANLKRYDI